MSVTRSFRDPFWALTILATLIAFYYCYSIYILMNERHVPISFINTLVWQFSITVVLLCFECLIYWKFQRQIPIKWIAWCHVILVYFALSGSPILFTVGMYLVRIQYEEESYISLVKQVANFRMIFYWSCLLVGHIFFLATIIRALSYKDITGNPANESSDILDEFAA